MILLLCAVTDTYVLALHTVISEHTVIPGDSAGWAESLLGLETVAGKTCVQWRPEQVSPGQNLSWWCYIGSSFVVSKTSCHQG